MASSRRVEFDVSLLNVDSLADPSQEAQSGTKKPTKPIKPKYRFGIAFQGYDEELTDIVEPSDTAIPLTTKKNYSVEVDEVLVNSILNKETLLHLRLHKTDDDKTWNIIGTTVFDFSPFITGKKLVIEDWFVLRPFDEFGNILNEESNGRVQVRVSVNEPILLQDDIDQGNFFTVSVGQLKNLPTSWNPSENRPAVDNLFDYLLQINLPVGANEDKRYYFALGRMKDGEQKKYVEWPNSTKQFFLSSVCMARLEKMSANGDPFKFNLVREIRKDKIQEGWIDHNYRRYRGTAGTSLRILLNPGCTKINAELLLQPVQPDRVDPNFDEIDALKKPRSADKKKKAPPKKVQIPTELMPEDGSSVDDVASVNGDDGVISGQFDPNNHPYVQSGTSISVSLSLSEPIIPLPSKREKTSMKPSELIPKRKKVEKKIDGTERYKKQVAAVVDMLAEEYAILSRTKGKPTQEEFVFYLNDTGKYHSFKEKLKSTVIQIVKEKFQNESNKKNEMEKMYNDLYVYLINQMHTTINKIFDSVHESEVVIIGADGKPTDKWRRLADEAEFEENFAVAAQYHQERVASVEDSYDPDLWYDYGVFSMRVRDYAKAEQSFREAIAIDMAYLPSLQAYGCILCSKGYLKEAEVFLQSVVDLKGQDAVAWGLLSLYFELVEKSKEARQACLMGQKLYLESGQQPVSYRNKIASYLLDLQLDVLAEKILVREEVQDEETFYNMAQVYYIRKEYPLAEEALNNAIKQKVRTEKVWHLFGRIYTVQGKLTEAQQAYETALSVAQESQDALLYLRIGSIYLKLQRYEDAKNMYLQACKYWPCGIAWLGVGISYYRLDDLIHAEQSLNEANIQNNLDPNVWAYLALVCARQQRFEEAQKALKESIKHGLNDEDLKKEIGVQQ